MLRIADEQIQDLFDLLYLLVSTPYRVYTFEQIYDIVWKEQHHGDINNIIWCLVRRIRKKLNKIEPRAGDIIKNACNIGYSFELIENKNTYTDLTDNG